MTKGAESLTILRDRFPEAGIPDDAADFQVEDFMVNHIVEKNPGIDYAIASAAADNYIKSAEAEAFLRNHPRLKPGSLPK